MNLELYRMFFAPAVRAAFAPFASLSRQLHPLRLQYELLSDANPAMRAVEGLAETVRANRRPVSADNPFLQMQEQFSEQMVKALDAWRDARDQASERMFLSIYSSPALQAMLGISPDWTRPRAGHLAAARALVEARKAELRSRMGEGGLCEALLRGLLYVVSAFGGRRRARLRGDPADPRRARGQQGRCRLQGFKRACASSSSCC